MSANYRSSPPYPYQEYLVINREKEKKKKERKKHNKQASNIVVLFFCFYIFNLVLLSCKSIVLSIDNDTM